MALSAKHSAFVQAYVTNGCNGTAAYIAAGYTGSPETGAKRLLDNPAIAGEIHTQLAIAQQKTGIDATWVLTELKRQYEKADGDDDRRSALQALSRLGDHIDVQAFKIQTAMAATISHEDALDELERYMPASR